MRAPLTRTALVLATTLALTACSGEGTPKDPETDGTLIEITISGDTVDPSGDQVKVPLGEPVTLDITSDRAGELHVHSTPEEVVEFVSGDTEAELSFNRPGVVEVEDHESGKVVVELQVS